MCKFIAVLEIVDGTHREGVHTVSLILTTCHFNQKKNDNNFGF